MNRTYAFRLSTFAMGVGLAAALACLMLAQGLYHETLDLGLPTWAQHALVLVAGVIGAVYLLTVILVWNAEALLDRQAGEGDEADDVDGCGPELIDGVWMYRCRGCGGMFRRDDIRLIGIDAPRCLETCAQDAREVA